MANIPGFVFFIAFAVLIQVLAFLNRRRFIRLRNAWAVAREGGFAFRGDFPDVSIVRGPVSFAVKTVTGAKGAVFYSQAYVARDVSPNNNLLSTDSRLMEKLDLARALSLKLQLEGDTLVATCDGLASPEEVKERLDAVETLARALIPAGTSSRAPR